MKILKRVVMSMFCLVAAFLLPMAYVQAAEESDSETYEYHIEYYTSYVDGYRDDKIYKVIGVIDISSKTPLAGYRNDGVSSDGYTFICSPDLEFFVTEYGDNFFDGKFYNHFTGERYTSRIALGTPNFSDSKYTQRIAEYTSCNVPIFATEEQALHYLETGDDTGQINKPGYHPDITDARFFDADCFLVNPTMNYTKGTSALSGTLSTFMGIKLNNGFYSYSSRNMKYTFLWDDVNTSFETDLSLSHMKIDIICNDQVYTFSDSDYLLSSGCIEITLQDILSFLSDNDVQPVIESFFIRYTPFYKVGLKTYYGRSVRFFVKANSDGVLSESLGDDLYGSNSDYSESDIVSPDDLPVKIPGFTDDESFEFDFSYDSDNMFKNFFNSLKSLISYCGQIPLLVNKVFSFLPDVYGNMIVIILAACFVMRLLGR